jgi:hypothetical protein
MATKFFFFASLAISLTLAATSVPAQDLTTHSAYRVTSYDLNGLLNHQDGSASRYLVDFKPLLITNNVSDILSSEHFSRVSLGKEAPDIIIEGIALSATFDATRKISLQGAFGVTRNHWVSDALKSDSEASWEANLGVIYKFLDYLSYELHFGYMDSGSLFIDRSSYSNEESIIMVSNRLTMSF